MAKELACFLDGGAGIYRYFCSRSRWDIQIMIEDLPKLGCDVNTTTGGRRSASHDLSASSPLQKDRTELIWRQLSIRMCMYNEHHDLLPNYSIAR